MKRDLYWDSIKTVLIFLVIYGHILSPYAPDGSFNRALYSFIYTFHMPLFIFISGRFSHIHDRQRYKKRIILLLETFVVFQIIRTAIPYILENELRNFLCPRWILWYLVSLIYWRLMIYFIPERWFHHRCPIILVSIVISLLAGYIPIHSFLGVQSTLALLPFFILGYYSTDINIRSYIIKIPIFVAIGIMLSTFCFFYFVRNINLDYVFGCFPYWTDDKETLIFARFVERCFFIPLSVIISAMVLRIIPANRTLAVWGEKTLFVFIYHSFAVRELLIPLIDAGFLPQNKWSLFAYTVIIFLGLLLLSHFKLFNILLNPITYFRSLRI